MPRVWLPNGEARRESAARRKDTASRCLVNARVTDGRRIGTWHSNSRQGSDFDYNFTAYDHDGGSVIMERRHDSHLAAYAYGPPALDAPHGAAALKRAAFAACPGFGPISRTILDADSPLYPILPLRNASRPFLQRHRG